MEKNGYANLSHYTDDGWSGAKMYNHRHRTARYKKDIYTKVRGRWIAPEDDYNCSNYNLGRQKLWHITRSS
ncbi:hypothetical protein [Parablautia muri]|uniref:hypothetical protein n=1 Tax=Parablautia muri TaxID=2320879 RepID=UPI001372212B|nr:hypothetical protein [Parablautia muri]